MHRTTFADLDRIKPIAIFTPNDLDLLFQDQYIFYFNIPETMIAGTKMWNDFKYLAF